jgi:hypothetical protein
MEGGFRLLWVLEAFGKLAANARRNVQIAGVSTFDATVED